jgi:hypothetical protein
MLIWGYRLDGRIYAPRELFDQVYDVISAALLRDLPEAERPVCELLQAASSLEDFRGASIIRLSISLPSSWERSIKLLASFLRVSADSCRRAMSRRSSSDRSFMLGPESRRTKSRRVKGITLSSSDRCQSKLPYCGIPSGSYCSERNIATQFSNRAVEEVTPSKKGAKPYPGYQILRGSFRLLW